MDPCCLCAPCNQRRPHCAQKSNHAQTPFTQHCSSQAVCRLLHFSSCASSERHYWMCLSDHSEAFWDIVHWSILQPLLLQHLNLCWLYPHTSLRLEEWRDECRHKEWNNCAVPQRSQSEQGRVSDVQHFKPVFMSLHPISWHCFQHKSQSSTKDTQGLEKQREIRASVWMSWRLGTDLHLKDRISASVNWPDIIIDISEASLFTPA